MARSEILMAAGSELTAAGQNPSSTWPEARVGPNSIIQLIDTLRASQGEEVTKKIFESAALQGHLLRPPAQMVPESDVRILFDTLLTVLPPDQANSVLAEAGRRTADYIIANRIPAPVRTALPLLPAAWAVRALLKAIQRHAWTFAGSGTCSIATSTFVGAGAGRSATIILSGNPLATPGCPWHRAVFTRMLARLVSKPMDVQHAHCCGLGDEVCSFSIVLRGPREAEM